MRALARVFAIAPTTIRHVCCLLLFLSAEAATAQVPDEDLVHFSFATLLGTGVYQLDDRTIAILRSPFGWQLRDATPEKPGIRFVMPTAVGLHNYEFLDDFFPDLDEQLATISVVPGIELQYLIGERWRVTPGAYLGFGADVTNGDSSLIYGAQLSALYAMKPVYPQMNFGTAVILSGYDPETGSGDVITRWSAGFDAKFPTNMKFGDGNIFLGGHAIGYIYLDGVEFERVVGEPTELTREVELGVFIGARPRPKLFGIEIDRLGIGYRFSSVSDAIVFFAGFPF
jgi:hypothetical protein